MPDKRDIKATPGSPASCGFICPICASRLLLSDVEISSEIMACFKLGGTSTIIQCPHCGAKRTYKCEELKLFGSEEPGTTH